MTAPLSVEGFLGKYGLYCPPSMVADLTALLDAARAEEREACAEVARCRHKLYGDDYDAACTEIADAILALRAPEGKG